MSTYYRYFRPVQFDFARGELVVKPRGGICFQINDDDFSKQRFSYSICHNADVFSKKAARNIANDRMNRLLQHKSSSSLEQMFQDSQFKPLTHHENEVIIAVEKFIQRSEDYDVFGEDVYAFGDLLLLQEKINKIQVTHELAYAMLKEWKRGDMNKALRSFYENQNW